MRLDVRHKRSRSRAPGWGWVYWVLAALALVLLGWLVWRQTRGRPAGSAPTPPPPALPAPAVLVPPPPSVLPPMPNLPAQPPPTNPPPAPTPTNIPVVPAPTDAPAVPAPVAFKPRPAQSLFEAQVALARQAISPGSVDGVPGSQTRAALRAFQRRAGLRLTGDFDEATRRELVLAEPPLTDYLVTTNDLARLRPLGKTWWEKSQQDQLDYETVLELVAEQSAAHPQLIHRLNPGIDWTNLFAGTVLQTPRFSLPAPRGRAAFAQIELSARVLQVFDARRSLLAHFPCSIAQRVDKRPVGELHVMVIASSPDYTFDPAVFPESAEARQLNRKLKLPPGPNNPVGLAWIGLDRPGYGIHGTPRPEEVGRTESHGCFRLANWNATFLVKLVWVGMPVHIEP